jgi:hypothetical protein
MHFSVVVDPFLMHKFRGRMGGGIVFGGEARHEEVPEEAQAPRVQ